MSTPSAQGRPVDEAAPCPTTVTEIDYDEAMQDDSQREPVISPGLRLQVPRIMPGYLSNRHRREVIMNRDIPPRRDTTTGLQPVRRRLPSSLEPLRDAPSNCPLRTSLPRHRFTSIESPWGDRQVPVGFNRLLHPRTLESIRANHNVANSPPAQQATTSASLGVAAGVSQRPVVPFPHRELQGQQGQRERQVPQRGTPSSRPEGPVRNILRPQTSNLSLPRLRQPQEQREPQVQREQPTQQERQQQPQRGQQIPVANDSSDATFPYEARQPIPTPAIELESSSTVSGPLTSPVHWQAWPQAEAQAQAEAHYHRRTQRRDASPSPVREERRDTDHRFRHLLSRYHTRAAPPTPPSRPPHSQARRGLLRVFSGRSVPIPSSRSSENSSLDSLRGSASGSRSARSSGSGSSPWSTNTTTSQSSRTHRPSRSRPRPLTRRTLLHHARSRILNPSGHAWHALPFLTHIHRLRARYAAQARTLRPLIRAIHERTAAEAAMEEAAVQQAVLQLALVGALTDARAVVADTEQADEEGDARLRTSSSSRRGRSRSRTRRRAGRGWIPTARIMAPQEHCALRSALARRSTLGERMGLDHDLEEVLGRGLGRWAFDIWVASAATAASSSSAAAGDGDGSGTRSAGERIGAVWLGPPASSGDAFESDDGVRTWHFVDGDVGQSGGGGGGLVSGGAGRAGGRGRGRADVNVDMDMDGDGVCEGWVEWVERTGCFVVHDVFR